MVQATKNTKKVVIVSSNSPPLLNMCTKVRYLGKSLRITWSSFGLKFASPAVTDRLHLQIILLTSACCVVVLSRLLLAA
jgi:hypothetical protein